MTDLAQIERALYGVDLDKAIRTNDRGAIAVCLRALADGQLSPDIVNKLADYLDPAIENPLYKCGPRPKKKRLFVERNMAIHLYKTLCEDKVLPSRKEIKGLVCKMHGICSRTFETWLAEYNKK